MSSFIYPPLIPASPLVVAEVDTNQIKPQSGGTIILGGVTTDLVEFIAGDVGAVPSNTTTPAKWIKIKDSSGAVYFFPVYQ